jgi:hypothetical protein
LNNDCDKCEILLENLKEQKDDNNPITYVFKDKVDLLIVEKYELDKDYVYSSSNIFDSYPQLVIITPLYKEKYDDLDAFQYFNFEQ